MKDLKEYIDARITETNKNILFYKKKISEFHRVHYPDWVKLHTNNYLYYHGLLGELAVLNEIKSKLKNEIVPKKY